MEGKEGKEGKEGEAIPPPSLVSVGALASANQR